MTTNNESFYARMHRKLTDQLQPILLEIKDDSKKHAGHSGHDPRGETHFFITAVSEKFEGLNSVARHRLIYGIVADELKERVHALNLHTIAPSEYNPK